MSSGDAVNLVASQLRQKAGTVIRCCTEYLTYLEEEQEDKKRVADLKAANGYTRQATEVLKETTEMISIVKKNAERCAESYMRYYEEEMPRIRTVVGSIEQDKSGYAPVQEILRSLRLFEKLWVKQAADPSAFPLTPDVIDRIKSFNSQIIELCKQN